MTCTSLPSGSWRMSFSEPEALFFINILSRLAEHYQQNLDELPPCLRAYWQGVPSKRDREREALDESQEVLAEARAELRSERQALAENWIREFEIAEKRDPWTVELTGAERDEFVAMLNDRRMLLALELGLTDEDMESSPKKIPEEARRNSILEIDVLGHFILITLGPQIHRP